jgi:hypothetical protein
MLTTKWWMISDAALSAVSCVSRANSRRGIIISR